MKVKLLEVVKEGGNKVDISEAKILVSGGRGVGAKQNFELLEDLAAEIGGIVSSSRAQVDAGNMPHDRQVGQTGKTVRLKFISHVEFQELSNTLLVWKNLNYHRYQQR